MDYKTPNEEQFQNPYDFSLECPEGKLSSRYGTQLSYKGKMNHLSNNEIKKISRKDIGKVVLQNDNGIRTRARTKQ